MVLQLWDPETGALLRTFSGHTNWVSAVAASPDGTLICTASWDKLARVWDADSGKLVSKLEGHAGYLSACAFSPSGKEVRKEAYPFPLGACRIPAPAHFSFFRSCRS